MQVAGEADFLGFAYTQFALPVVAGPLLDFDFNPAPNLQSPPALGMLLGRVGRRYVWLAPVDHPHEQVIAVTDGALRWGWHGDLDEVPAGFSSTLGIFEGDGVADVLERWGDAVRAGRRRRSRHANSVTSHLSYWTDNGAAYWYRTEAGRTIGASVAEAVEALVAGGVPIRAVELDSWCYHHEIPRPITELGYPEDVPPSGLMTWEPRPDAFDPPSAGRDAIEEFSERLGRPPLVIHTRHISPRSPYLAEGEWWIDALAAHPVDPTFFRRWFDDARRWGVCAIEQDWMLMYWFGVRALRAAPDRAAELAADARRAGRRVRRRPDLVHGDAGRSRARRHARSRGRRAHERRLPLRCRPGAAVDVVPHRQPHRRGPRPRRSSRTASSPAVRPTAPTRSTATSTPSWRHCWRACRPDRSASATAPDAPTPDVVLRTCDDDGRIRHVDRPLALIDGCLFGEPARGERLAWATTTATRRGLSWTYVVAVNTSADRRVLADELALADIGLTGPAAVYDWRQGQTATVDSIAVELAPRDWALWVCAPPGERADAGDLRKYVTVDSDLT